MTGRRISIFRRIAGGLGSCFRTHACFPTSQRGKTSPTRENAPAGAHLEIAEVAEFFDIASLLDRPISNLSGGEKSRVALARALVSAPDYLLLDEPFAALDGTRRRSFIEVLLATHRKYRLPMMIVTHNIDDAAALASHLVGLNEGRVVAAGPFGMATQLPAFQALLDSRDIGSALAADALRKGRDDNIAQQFWLRADYVLLASERPGAISARNIIQGEVHAIHLEDAGSILVELRTAEGVHFIENYKGRGRRIGTGGGGGVLGNRESPYPVLKRGAPGSTGQTIASGRCGRFRGRFRSGRSKPAPRCCSWCA